MTHNICYGQILTDEYHCSTEKSVQIPEVWLPFDYSLVSLNQKQERTEGPLIAQFYLGLLGGKLFVQWDLGQYAKASVIPNEV